MPTSLSRSLKVRSDVAGAKDGVERSSTSAESSSPRNGRSISSALGVGCISWPLRVKSGSPNRVRRRARTLLIEGWVVPSCSAARVRLRSRSSTSSTRRSRRLRSAFRIGHIVHCPSRHGRHASKRLAWCQRSTFEGARRWRGSSSSRICGCTNGSPKRRAIFRGRSQLRVPGVAPRDGGAHHPGRKWAPLEHRAGPPSKCQLRLPLDRQCGGLSRPRQNLCRRLFGRAVRDFRAARIRHSLAGRPCRHGDLGRVPIGQPLLDDPGPRAIHAVPRHHQALLRRGHAVQPHGGANRAQNRRLARCSAGPITSSSSSGSGKSSIPPS